MFFFLRSLDSLVMVDFEIGKIEKSPLFSIRGRNPYTIFTGSKKRGFLSIFN